MYEITRNSQNQTTLLHNHAEDYRRTLLTTTARTHMVSIITTNSKTTELARVHRLVVTFSKPAVLLYMKQRSIWL